MLACKLCSHTQVDVQDLASNVSSSSLPVVGLALSNTSRGTLLVSASELTKSGAYMAKFTQVSVHIKGPGMSLEGILHAGRVHDAKNFTLQAVQKAGKDYFSEDWILGSLIPDSLSLINPCSPDKTSMYAVGYQGGCMPSAKSSCLDKNGWAK